MSTDIAMKVDVDHLRRDAFLYVRQSSLCQVFENTSASPARSAVQPILAAIEETAAHREEYSPW
ncbi:hypothetical protein ILFOPFJJ_07026 [Ensifer psoraleae]|nr:hypothetical protein [Sinorhizobium psoraleae]